MLRSLTLLAPSAAMLADSTRSARMPESPPAIVGAALGAISADKGTRQIASIIIEKNVVVRACISSSQKPMVEKISLCTSWIST